MPVHDSGGKPRIAGWSDRQRAAAAVGNEGELLAVHEVLDRFAEIEHPMAKFPGKAKNTVKQWSFTHPNLKRILDFSQARMAFRVATLFPILFVGGFIRFLIVLTEKFG